MLVSTAGVLSVGTVLSVGLTVHTDIMGVALVAGCGLIAFGPSAMLWIFVVGKRPALVIIAIVRYSGRYASCLMIVRRLRDAVPRPRCCAGESAPVAEN